MLRRFFLKNKSVIDQASSMGGSDAKHIRTALRMKPGDRLVVFDGQGNDFEAEIEAITSNEIKIVPLKKVQMNTDSPVQISIAQAMLKGKKMDLLARQITELGITRWIPFISERTVPMLKSDKQNKRLQRWQTIMIESLKQCRRSKLPQIDPVVSFEQALAAGSSEDFKLIFWEEESQSLRDVLKTAPKACKNVFAVLGPEGGFSEAEVNTAKSLNYHSASLGPRILKAETATVTVCSVLQYYFGDLGGK
jgi:16S rRNA (uracil1498-N3)-methyltransferase